MTLITRVGSGLLIAVAALGLALAGPGAAGAHGGGFDLALAPTGDGGLVVSATYLADGHVVSQLMDPVASAIADDGTTAGPVALISSAEGVGLWNTAEPFLATGNWTVTVSTTTPAVATATVEMTVAELAPAPTSSTVAVEPIASQWWGGAWGWVAGVGGVLAAAALGLALWWRHIRPASAVGFLK